MADRLARRGPGRSATPSTPLLLLPRGTSCTAGNADVLREQLGGRTGLRAEYEQEIDTAARATHRAKIERAAQAADGGAGNAASSAPHGAVETAQPGRVS